MIQIDAQCAQYEREYESVSYKNIEILEVLESKYLL